MLSALIIALLIALNAFFAAAEIGTISSREALIRDKAEQGLRSAQLVLDYFRDPGRFLATIQVGITLTGFFASAIAATTWGPALAALLRRTGIRSIAAASNVLAIIVVTFLVSYVMLVLGELTPKRLAILKADRLALLTAEPINIIGLIAYPFVKVLTFSTNLVIRIFGVHPEEVAPAATDEELKLLITRQGTLLEEEKELLHHAFEIGDIVVRQIMVPRPNVCAINESATADQAIHIAKTAGYSRLPVYRGSLDNIIGIVHLKDLIQFLEENRTHEPAASVLRPIIYVPETRRALSVLKDLQRSQTHMAVVLDEYGGTSGVVTIEDVLEEIVGEIRDEYEIEPALIRQLTPTETLVNGRTTVDLLNERLNLRIPESPEYDTLAGWVLTRLGHIPTVSESFDHEGVRYTVHAMDRHRVALVKLTSLPQEQAA